MLKGNLAKNIVSNGHMLHIYGIPKGTPFDEHHLLALKLWTDNDILARTVYRILRLGVVAEVAQIAHWTRILTETVRCFGSPMDEKSALWIPVGREYYFTSIEFALHLPVMLKTSVTLLVLHHVVVTIMPLILFMIQSFLKTFVNVETCSQLVSKLK